MSKYLVVYQSSTGFTKRYAQWIAEELHADVTELKKIKDVSLENYDTIIYGGWIMGNTIVGLDKVRALSAENLTLFATGATQASPEIEQTIREVNKLEKIPFFYMPGGMQFDRLNVFARFMLKTIKKSIAKKENKSEQDKYMEKVLGTSFDISDKKYIRPLIESMAK